MVPFELAEPKSLVAAVAMLDHEDRSVPPDRRRHSTYLSMMKSRLYQPRRLWSACGRSARAWPIYASRQTARSKSARWYGSLTCDAPQRYAPPRR